MPNVSEPSPMGPDLGEGRLRPARTTRERVAVSVVVAMAHGRGIDVTDAGVWRAGSSVLVGLPAAGVLGRVDDPRRAEAARRQVVVSEVLAARGVPAITLTGAPDQPVLTEAGPVTLWEWLPVLPGAEARPRELGRLARHLHDATRGGAARVPAYEPLTAVTAELDRAEMAGLTRTDDLSLLRDRVGRLAAAWPAPDTDPLGRAVVHGDLHRHNALVVEGRRLVLADLELAGVGPASADLVPHVVSVRRYAAPPQVLDEFLAGYGRELPRWPGFEVLVDAYELWATAWAVANRGASPALAEEADLRVDRWRPGVTSSRPWSLR
jgi:hypothetical protein